MDSKKIEKYSVKNLLPNNTEIYSIEFQKSFVRKSIKKYNENPTELIEEIAAWKKINDPDEN